MEEEVKESLYLAALVPKKEFKPIDAYPGEAIKTDKVPAKNTGSESWPEAVCLYQISPRNVCIIQGSDDFYLKIESVKGGAFKRFEIPIVAP